MKDAISRRGAETRKVKNINGFSGFPAPLRPSGRKNNERCDLAQRRRDAESEKDSWFFGFPAPLRLSGRKELFKYKTIPRAEARRREE